MQTDLFETHCNDNNQESNNTLNINRKSFEGQNKKLFNILMRGYKVSFSDAYILYGISDIRRRSKDLVDMMGVQISKQFIPGTRNKVWFFTPEQIKYNSTLIK